MKILKQYWLLVLFLVIMLVIVSFDIQLDNTPKQPPCYPVGNLAVCGDTPQTE